MSKAMSIAALAFVAFSCVADARRLQGSDSSAAAAAAAGGSAASGAASGESAAAAAAAAATPGVPHTFVSQLSYINVSCMNALWHKTKVFAPREV